MDKQIINMQPEFHSLTIPVVLDAEAYLPEKAHSSDAGFDLRTREEKTVPARGNAIFDTGVHMAIPNGFVGFLKSKSGLNVKYNLTGTGVIDAGYTGSICVKLYNHSDTPYTFNKGDKIIQIVILPIFTGNCELVESLEDTERGEGGFGSTGK